MCWEGKEDVLGGEGRCVGRGKEDVLGREGGKRGKERDCEF